MAIWNRSKQRKAEKIEKGLSEYFKIFNAYSPAFKTYQGGVYEMELTRAAVHAKANCLSKLKPVVSGSNNQAIERILQYYPNPIMDTKKYLYRLGTILFTANNAFIAPLYDKYYEQITGFYPLHPAKCQLKNYNGELWLIYEFYSGKTGVIEFSKCGRLNQFQNKDEIFGENNQPLRPTLELMDANNQAIVKAVEESSNIKFLAKLVNSLRPDDVNDERENFTKNNLRNNDSGVMLIDAKYSDVKQIESKQFTIDDKQMDLIKQNVFDYFGVSENILQGNYKSEEAISFYESQIEPVALELSLQHTRMLFTDREIAFGNKVEFSANRFSFLSPGEKVTYIQTLFDRGLLTPNEAREIINMSPIENGDNFYIRKEYLENYNQEENENDTEGQNESEE